MSSAPASCACATAKTRWTPPPCTPESYDAAKALLATLGYRLEDIRSGGLAGLSARVEERGLSALAQELGVGEPTLRDIVRELQKPGRDPRDDLPSPILRTDVLDMKDLAPGMELRGTVRNVIDFGAFVDIGVHQDGLVHISRMSNRFIRAPFRGGQGRRCDHRLGGGCGPQKAAHRAKHAAARPKMMYFGCILWPLPLTEGESGVQ